MVSTQLNQQIADLDEVIASDDEDFQASGLKLPSLIRTTRLAVVEDSVLLGQTGAISDSRLRRIRAKLARWLKAST